MLSATPVSLRACDGTRLEFRDAGVGVAGEGGAKGYQNSLLNLLVESEKQ